MASRQVRFSPEAPERVVAYVDGFNLYFGLRQAGFRRYYWLDIALLAANLLKPYQHLVSAKYFTARISGSDPSDPPSRAADLDASRDRQVAFLDALATRQGLSIYEGHFLRKDQKCHRCGNVWVKPEEKMTDVRIATELLCDAFADGFDMALVISGDSDLVPPIEAVKRLHPSKRVIVALPPKRNSAQLRQTADACLTIGRKIISDSQLPDSIVLPNGMKIDRPERWTEH